MKDEVQLIDSIVEKASELFRAECISKSFDASYYGGVNRGFSLIIEAYQQLQGATNKAPIVEHKSKSEETYRIYMSSAEGLSYIGVTASSEDESIELCNKYDHGAGSDCTYCKHVYKKV